MTIQSMVHDYENMGLSTMYGYTDEDELEIETAVETPLEDPSSRRQLFVHSTDDDEVHKYLQHYGSFWYQINIIICILDINYSTCEKPT